MITARRASLKRPRKRKLFACGARPKLGRWRPFRFFLRRLFVLAVRAPAPASEAPVAWWKFDGQAAVDSVDGVTNALQGNYKFMPEGVRGGCLRFDGLYHAGPARGRPGSRNVLTKQTYASCFFDRWVLEALCTMGRQEYALLRMYEGYKTMIPCSFTTLWEHYDRWWASYIDAFDDASSLKPSTPASGSRWI